MKIEEDIGDWLFIQDLLPPPKDEDFATWTFPVIKSMAFAPDLISQLVQVQPMAGTVSQIFWMDIVHRER